MAVFSACKVVATLPGVLAANTLYLVRTGTGFRPWVTNSAGTIVAYPLDPISWSELGGIPANIAALAALTSAADKGIQFTGSGAAGLFDLTAAGKALLDDIDAAAQRVTLGLGNVTNDAQVPKSILTTKGDLIVASGSATPIRLAVGADGSILVADSSQTGGVKWAVPLPVIRWLGLDIRDAEHSLLFANSEPLIVDRVNAYFDGIYSTSGINSGASSGYTADPVAGLIYPSLLYPQRITTGTPSAGIGSGGGGTAADFNDDNTGTTYSRAQGNLTSVSAVASRIFAKLDLGASVSISKVELKQLRLTAGSTAADQIYTSTDNVNWTAYGATFASNTTATDIVREGVVTCRYVAHVLSQVNYSTTVVISDLNVYDGNGYTEQSATWLGSGTHTAGYTNFNRDFALDNSTKVATIGIYSAAAGTVCFKMAEELTSTSFNINATTADLSHPGGGWADYVIPAGWTIPASGTIRPGYLWRSGGSQSSALPTLARAYKSGDQTGAGNTGFVNTAGGCHALRVTYSSSTSNVDLRSGSRAITDQPSEVDVYALIEETQALTPGTDLILQGSRDGGTNWLPSSQAGLGNTTGLCRRVATLANGLSLFVATGISVSAQSGLKLPAWRLQSPTGKSYNLIAIGIRGWP